MSQRLLQRPLKQALTQVEAEIEQVEIEKDALAQLQLDPSHYEQSDEVIRVAQKIKQYDEKLIELMDQWEQIETELEALKARFE